jgi:hypothetical protein
MAQVFFFNNYGLNRDRHAIVTTDYDIGIKLSFHQPQWLTGPDVWVQYRGPVIKIETYDYNCGEPWHHEHESLTMKGAWQLARWLTARVIEAKVRKILRRPTGFNPHADPPRGLAMRCQPSCCDRIEARPRP